MVSTKEKGDELEETFYRYLIDEQNRGDFVYGAYPPNLCKIYKKKKYFCKVRESDVEFDVVIELFCEGRSSPHSFVVFECKNQGSPIQEREINDFSAKLGRVFQHAAKGVVVVSSPLQSGADKVARNSKMGIVKYDEHGFEVIADRKGRTYAENRFVELQIFENINPVKPLKFSAYRDGKFFSSIDQFLSCFDSSQSFDKELENSKACLSVPYLPLKSIKDSAHAVLKKISYKRGSVDVEKICSALSIELHFTKKLFQDESGNIILGSANFDKNSILINSHENIKRERFTIGHEIGHFFLRHDRYLRSECLVERDLLVNDVKEDVFNYERLEFQANTFASELLLPEYTFLRKTEEYRKILDIKDKGHGYIFVDDQPCNYGSYNQLLLNLSSYFEISMQAIEIKLKKMGMLTDQRKRLESLTIPKILSEIVR